jgi:tRNA modification GTPase
MNHLVRREAAIVSDHPGTTRDLINVDLDIGGIAVTLSDTAGIRATDNPVELIGIDRALSAVHNASVVLWLFEVLGPAPDALPELACPSIIVGSKLDLSAGLPDWADLGVSTTIAGGLDELLHRLEVIVSGLAAGEPTLVTNERQLLCVASAARSLRRALEVDALELVAEDLRACSSQLEILLGRLNTDDVLGAVFSRFCMGK